MYTVVFSTRYIKHSREEFILNHEIKAVINYLSENKSVGLILIDIDSGHEYPEPVAIYSDLRIRKSIIAEEIEVNGKMLVDDRKKMNYRHSLIGKIAERKVDYILYAPEGRSLRWLIPLSRDKEVIGGVEYRRVFKGDIYWIYKAE